jgi:protein phosphatase
MSWHGFSGKQKGKDMELDHPLKIEFYTISDQGTREYQQDTSYVEVRGDVGMAVVCDGMGGLSSGEKASATGVKQFIRDLKEAWPVKDLPSFLEGEAHRLDRAVYELADEKGNRLNAGSTVVSAIIVNNQLYWMSVGDSRLYLLRDGSLRCLTTDHNYKTMLQQKLEAGLIDMDFYNGEISRGEALTSYLGLGSNLLVDRNQKPFTLVKGDILLLCSDGLYKTLTEEQIQVLVNESGNYIPFAGKRLIEQAGRWGSRGQDNTTLILLQMTENTDC